MFFLSFFLLEKSFITESYTDEKGSSRDTYFSWMGVCLPSVYLYKTRTTFRAPFLRSEIVLRRSVCHLDLDE